jgi:hypothetical protein
VQYVPLVYDDMTVEYDVIVDEAPTAPNVKQRTWEAFTLLAEQLPALITPQTALIALDYSPFPQAMVQKLKKLAQQAPTAAPPNPVEQAEIANLSASAALKGAQTEKTRAQTATGVLS